MTLTAEQKQLRTQGVGGSDAAACCGLSPWKTPYQLWHDKVHGSTFNGNESTDWGHFCEPFIREQYEARTGYEVEQPPMLRHPEHDWMLANLDGIANGNRIFEAKTANARMASEWGEPGTDDVPIGYKLQVQHYMAVTGFEVADIAVLIGDSRRIQIYTVPTDLELQKSLIVIERDFWLRVVDRNPPEPTTAEDVALRWPKNDGDLAEVDSRIADQIEELKRHKQHLKQIAERVTEIETEIKKAIQDHDGIKIGDKTLATWKASKDSTRFDADLLRRERPEVWETYQKTIPGSRRLLIK